MKLSLIKRGITQGLGRTVLRTKKNSPHIFFGIGVVGVVTSTVLACRATLKLGDTLDGIQKDVNDVKTFKDPQTEVERFDQSRDLARVYMKAGFEITKLYGPPIVLGVVSVGCITGSHVQLSRRNAALGAAYTGVKIAFDEYRDRVRKIIGEEQEIDIYHGVEPGIDPKTLLEVKTIDPTKLSVHSKIFDETNKNWVKDPELNRIFVQAQQNYLNQRLLARGHLFLNEVYEALGFDDTKSGSVVGWFVGMNKEHTYIDFGLYDDRHIQHNGFINGWERSIILDFNVDGVIWDLMGGD